MLSSLLIRNFTIIDEVEIHLQPGMTVLTGETGAGKSILIDALGFSLGDRATSDCVAKESEQAEVTASFELHDSPLAVAWLQQQDLFTEQNCVMRRIVRADGRSRAYINGSPVPMQSLRQLGHLLVDIHGQHQHHSLLKPDTQRGILDAAADANPLLEQVANCYRALRQLEEQLQECNATANLSPAEQELLQHQLSELEAIAPQLARYDRLSAEHLRLSKSAELMETRQFALHNLQEDETSALFRLAQTKQALDRCVDYDPSLKPTLEALESIRIQLDELSRDLRAQLVEFDADPQAIAQLDAELGRIHDMARKHRVEISELGTVFEDMQQRVATAADRGARVAELQQHCEQAQHEYQEKADNLSAHRRKVAGHFSQEVAAYLPTLGMHGARFEAVVTAKANPQPSANGLDQVEFEISSNPGQEPRALRKIASGGELARISLAIQIAASDRTRIATQIFDEIDTGVGGGIAETVGIRLSELGQSTQVLCVTHLAQVAAQAQQHLQVVKISGEQITKIRVNDLADKHREEEIARMLGGIKITAQTRAHAREMLNQAASQHRTASAKLV